MRLGDGDYFFMEKLSGDNFIFVKDGMLEETIAQINREIGALSRELTDIHNAEFGFLGDERPSCSS